MEYIRNLEDEVDSEDEDLEDEVSEGTFVWSLDGVLKTKEMKGSPTFRFGRTMGNLSICCESGFLDKLGDMWRIVILTLKHVPNDSLVFSEVTLYNICLIDTSGKEIESLSGTIFFLSKQFMMLPVLYRDTFEERFQPDDTVTIRLSWYPWKKSSVHEEETHITQDLISEPHSTLLEKLSDDLRLLYDNQCNTDCVLKVDNVQFPAHRALLSARSTVFAAMFQHESTEKLSGVVEIRDFENEIVGNVLKYMYSGKIYGLDSETAVPMYELADKYAIFELRDHCICFLKNNMTTENVCDAAVLAHTHGETDLEEKVLQFIEERLEDIQQSNAWKNFVIANPLLAVKYLTSSFITCKKNKKDKQK